MIAWILLLGGILMAAVGTAVAVGAAAVSRFELARWVSQRLRGAAVASAMLSSHGRTLGAGNAIASLGVLLSGLGLAAVFTDLQPPWLSTAVIIGAVPVIAALVYTLPRAIGRRWSEAVVRLAAPWMDRFAGLFSPLLPSTSEPQQTELTTVFSGGEASGSLEKENLSVLSGIVAFSKRPVREVMTPRTDIVAVAEGAPLDEVARIFAESGYSRIPVYRDSLDNIIGMAYAFDLLKVTPGGTLPIWPVTMAPASKQCVELLFEMQRERRQFAVVLDEFGGTAGIATMGDLLQELVGEIGDSPTETGPDVSPSELIELDGSTACGDLAARFGVTLPDSAETVGGMLVRAASRIPQTGERYTMAGLEFDILAATPTRVARVAVRRGPVSVVRLGGGSDTRRD